MTNESTIHDERTAPKIAKITFSNPPVNLIVGETVSRLRVVDELDGDPDIQVVVFTSGVPDFFFNHFDLAAPRISPLRWRGCGAGVDRSRRAAVQGSVHHHRVYPRPDPGRRQRTRPCLDLRYASREHAIFGQPEVGGGMLPGGGGTERLPRRSDGTAHWRPSSPATTTTQTRRSGGAGSPGPFQTASSTPSWTPSLHASHPSTAHRWRPRRR